MKHYEINQCGRSHAYDNKPCEDAIAISEDNSVFCLADGVSNATKGGLGAAIHVKETVKYLCKKDIRQTLITADAKEIREKIAAFWRQLDEHICHTYSDARTAVDFASTMLCAVDIGKEIILLHAGDGIIFGLPSGGCRSVTVLSGPDNAPNGAVFYSGHPEQRNRMRVLRIRKTDYSKILLSTDGFSSKYYDPPFQCNLDLLERLLQSNSIGMFVAQSNEDHADEGDDISCILLDIGKEVVDAAPMQPPIARRHETPLLPEITKPEKRKGSQNTATPAKSEIFKKSKKANQKTRIKTGAIVALIAVLVLQASAIAFFASRSAAEISELKQDIMALQEDIKDVRREQASHGILRVS